MYTLSCTWFFVRNAFKLLLWLAWSSDLMYSYTWLHSLWCFGESRSLSMGHGAIIYSFNLSASYQLESCLGLQRDTTLNLTDANIDHAARAYRIHLSKPRTLRMVEGCTLWLGNGMTTRREQRNWVGVHMSHHSSTILLLCLTLFMINYEILSSDKNVKYASASGPMLEQDEVFFLFQTHQTFDLSRF